MTNQMAEALNLSLVDVFAADDHSESEIFHEYTKLNRENIGALSQRVGTIMRDPTLLRMMARSWKTYSGFPKISLPRPELGDASLADVIKKRRSVSSDAGVFASGPISLEQLSSVLAFSYGATRIMESPRYPGERHILRATTSAGGLYPLEIYPIVFDVEGLEPGVYHYRMVDHELEVLRRAPVKDDFIAAQTYEGLCDGAAVALVITAMFSRTLSKYLNRGYRFLLNDTGALLQSLYLAGTALEIGTCALGGFYDDEVGEIVGVNNVDEAVVMCFLLGQRAAVGPGPLGAVRPTRG
jgi:SagB-type dehydrogenase family enzyme